ncbi:efflux RND transporter periplasmic adaptor subunit [candidate division KSB1 bacterium]
MDKIKEYFQLKFLPVLLILIGLIYLVTNSVFAEKIEYELTEVKKGKFIKTLIETGEVQAVNFTAIEVPHLRRTQFQIIEMVDEGTVVKKGDILVRFDQSDILTNIETYEAQLEIQLAELEKLKVTQRDAIKRLENALDQAKYSLDLAEVRKELYKFETRIRQEEAGILMKQAQIDYDEASTTIQSQKIQNEAQLEKQQLRNKQIEERIERAESDLDLMTVISPMPGLVVYHQERFGPFGGQKVSVGDNVRPGQYIIQLPDLSKLKVVFGINEVDRDRVWSGQNGKVTFEAYPQVEFEGIVTQINKITDWFGGNESNVKLFSVEMELNEADDKIRPGLSAQIRLVLDEKDDLLQVPLSAVFEDNGKTFVMLKSSEPKPREVEIGERNYTHVEIKSGLQEGDKVVTNAVDLYGSKIGKSKYDYKISQISEFLSQHFSNIKKLGIDYDYDSNRGKVDTIKTNTDDFQLPDEVRKMLESRGIKITPEMIERFKKMQEGGGEQRMQFQMSPGQGRSEGQRRELRMNPDAGQRSNRERSEGQQQIRTEIKKEGNAPEKKRNDENKEKK